MVGALVGALVGNGVGMATHSVQPVTVFPVHLPAEHVLHTEYTSASWYLPSGQWTQLVDAVPSANLPESHVLHAWPVDSWNLPTAQAVHSVSAATAYRPFGQTSHASAL